MDAGGGMRVAPAVSVYLGDVGDPRPPTFTMPDHQVALARLGLPLVDAAALDNLATTCRAEHRCSFMLVLAPPPITGLAVNPIAILYAKQSGHGPATSSAYGGDGPARDASGPVAIPWNRGGSS